MIEPMTTIHLGAVSVTRIPLFENAPLTPAVFFPGTDPALWEANRSWLDPDHWDAATDRVRVSVHSWLLRSAGRTILIDTGLAPGSAHPGMPSGGSLPAGLAAVGAEPADVDLVLCTHLHADHVGGNTVPADGGWVPAFPPGSPEESHLRAPTDPYVNLSVYTALVALVTAPVGGVQIQCAKYFGARA